MAPRAGGLELRYYFFIAAKSFCIFLAWLCGFSSLKKLPVSIYGVLDLSRVVFLTLFGVIFIGERLTLLQFLGLIIVCLGLLLLKFKPKDKLYATSSLTQNEIDNSQKKERVWFYVVLALISCLLNATSGLLDKILMKDITSSQLQFWYMVFLVFYYLAFIVITRRKISFSVIKNYWVWILALMFVIGDKALFVANGITQSKVTTMTLIKQSGCVISILGGHFIFKERHTLYALFCAAIVIFGIVLGVLKI